MKSSQYYKKYSQEKLVLKANLHNLGREATKSTTTTIFLGSNMLDSLDKACQNLTPLLLKSKFCSSLFT